MKHIRFLSDNQTICDNPKRLDLFDSPVVIDYEPAEDKSCAECSQLLIAHNKNVYEDELAYSHNSMFIRLPEDPLSPARGLMWGILLGTLLWVPILLILWAVFF